MFEVTSLFCISDYWIIYGIEVGLSIDLMLQTQLVCKKLLEVFIQVLRHMFKLEFLNEKKNDPDTNLSSDDNNALKRF